MDLLTTQQRATMLEHGQQTALGETIDPRPVVKLFTPDGAATWLLTELDPDDTDIAFGLCDLGVGYPELGFVRLSELLTLRGKLGLPVERDLWFTPQASLSAYADAARAAEHIVDVPAREAV